MRAEAKAGDCAIPTPHPFLATSATDDGGRPLSSEQGRAFDQPAPSLRHTRLPLDTSRRDTQGQGPAMAQVQRTGRASPTGDKQRLGVGWERRVRTRLFPCLIDVEEVLDEWSDNAADVGWRGRLGVG